jgi:hypothetical protein
MMRELKVIREEEFSWAFDSLYEGYKLCADADKDSMERWC